MNADGHWLASDMYKINAVNKNVKCKQLGKNNKKIHRPKLIVVLHVMSDSGDPLLEGLCNVILYLVQNEMTKYLLPVFLSLSLSLADLIVLPLLVIDVLLTAVCVHLKY